MVGAVRARARVEQNVRRLHVAVHETARVGCVQRARHLREQSRRVGRIEPAALQPVSQVAPLDVAHGDEEEVVRGPRLVDRDDVRVVDRGGQLRLAQEAVAERRVLGDPGGEQLQRNAPLQPQILGQVDDPHAADAQQGFDPVAGQFGADPRVVAHLHVRTFFFGPLPDDRTLGRSCTSPALQGCYRRATRSGARVGRRSSLAGDETYRFAAYRPSSYLRFSASLRTCSA